MELCRRVRDCGKRFAERPPQCSYAAKLQEQLGLMAADVFPAAHDQERIRSVLADLSKTAAEFRDIAGRAVDHLATGSLLQLRSLLSPQKKHSCLPRLAFLHRTCIPPEILHLAKLTMLVFVKG